MSLQRIAVNVLATYTQNLISIVIGLFASRWVFLALGESQYGLFSLVGSLIAFVGMFNSLMTNSNARFFGLAIGRGRREGAEMGQVELQKWFNTSLSVHLVMAIGLCLAMYPLGLFFLRSKLNIPIEMLGSAERVFLISIVATFFAILNIPFHSLYTAKQLIFVRNLFGIMQTLFCAAEGWWLLHYSGNRLVAHSLITGLILVGLYVLMAAAAFYSFEECRIRVSYCLNKERLIGLFSYSSYIFLGAVGGMLSGPGVNVVLNMFFGTSINAVIGVGQQVFTKVGMLSAAMVSAVAPEVTSRVGSDDLKRAESLGLDICYISSIISIMTFVPFVMWLPEILVLWLKKPPVGSVSVTVILLVQSYFLKITSGYEMVIHATGKIKVFQTVLGLVNMSCVLVLWVLLSLGFSAIFSLAVSWVVPRALLSIGRVLFARRLLGMPVLMFVKRVLFPSILLLVLSVLCCTLVRVASRNIGVLGVFPGLVMNVIVVMSGVLFLDQQYGSGRFRTQAIKGCVRLLNFRFNIGGER